uniref:LD20463p n=1 Tax=Drosophila melanogaster TaxID=7227 RepID=Q7JQL2_DROME|nr:scaffold protein containing ankyrin repeats and SAM domain, isoform A [Drosophila melanogaster]NP_788340.1 scaffold protein containing ankyrin repeats and SAM domain, isoform B [Drosophila melanogaster]AOQ11773.1 Sans-RA [synthetic construct]AAF58438.1 scaffold protein containing ankyrin repeats and SAM domain, isoform A [Drosophila melanogaster]AAO41397.1 scaffold protein containing ankyrin repeats and SAM domain, isoform B [Drosophila melanogaster]AAQ21582.1 LD20463p [Drosophila melanogas|eukprot:NP_610829.1 scaffold protein containing ankyrin repeats and SAM domain, isoform A [Drosophila melanogaster]
MSSDRFHKAAKDGLLDVLAAATRKDTNAKDSDSMTPVMWAAFEGRLDALRLLCGRGGDPDKCDQFGNTALHLASAKGHLHCVDFLVKFGVNIYALDIDKHSAKDLAAINGRDEILRYLDVAFTNFEATEKKKSKALKELAEKNCEKRVREYMKRQNQQQQRQDPEYSDLSAPSGSSKTGNMLSTLKQKIWSSQGNLNKTPRDTPPPTKFSDLVGNGSSSSGGSTIASRAGTVQKRPSQLQKQHSSTCPHSKISSDTDGGFKVREVEPDGKRTITSLTGLQRDSEVLYVGTFSSNEDSVGKRGKISDVFECMEADELDHSDNRSGYSSTLARSFSQPDILGDGQLTQELSEEVTLQRPVGLFDRPTMLGSIAFRRSVTAALSQLQLHTDTSSTSTMRNAGSNPPKTRNGGGKGRLYLNLSDDTDSEGGGHDIYSDDDDDDRDAGGSALQRFLAVWALEEYLPVFQKQEIDLETLMLLTESDLKSLGLPLGPFRKLTFAIQERRNALANPGPLVDSRL